MADKTRFVTVAQFAMELDVQQRRVRRWCALGEIRAFQLPAGRGWRIARSEIDRVRRGEPLPMHAA